MVLNRDHERSRRMVVRIDRSRFPVDRFDVAERRWRAIDAPPLGDGALVRLALRPAEGALLRFGAADLEGEGMR